MVIDGVYSNGVIDGVYCSKTHVHSLILSLSKQKGGGYSGSQRTCLLTPGAVLSASIAAKALWSFTWMVWRFHMALQVAPNVAPDGSPTIAEGLDAGGGGQDHNGARD